MNNSINRQWFYALLILSMIFWGASWINVKILGEYINAYEVAFLRLLISIIVMIPLMLYLKLSYKVTLKTFFYALLASIVLVAYSVCFYMGTKHGTAGLGGALVTTLIPINTFIIVSFLQHKTLSIKQTFALVLGGFGVLTMLNIWHFDLSMIFSVQNIYFLLASFLWPILTIASSKASQTNPLVMTMYIYVLSTLLLLFFVDYHVIETSLSFDMRFWINMFVISVLSTAFATSVYFIGVEKLGTKEVSSFIFLVPSSALLLSALFLGEKIAFTTLLGTVCTITAIYILNNLKFSWRLKHK